MRLAGLLLLALLIGAGGFLATEMLGSRRLADPTDRCAEAASAARQAFEAGPMARNGLRVTDLGPPLREKAPQGSVAGLILCRAEASFSTGAQETLWYALVPAASGGAGQFMIHAAPGEMGRRNILALR
ncbi:hypothetical protein SAMN02745194_03803 [Roseomonas rosea]|uniref:Uncharacterized protein n=1 Tax=Muricoccus roseus TaxID=198092 RepID=A0A1M6NHJ2_9PROT|nr:hypothetical protein [Roseomonas rosea]SHJ95157.1 hypothetical protein SAMN02745194_03803 [Roseomonas rosea]